MNKYKYKYKSTKKISMCMVQAKAIFSRLSIVIRVTRNGMQHRKRRCTERAYAIK